MKMKKNIILAVTILFTSVLACQFNFNFSFSDNHNWSQYRADAGRTGYTDQELPDDLSLNWFYQQNAPSPAWQGVHTRMPFDYAYQTVIADKRLFFGSSSDCKIYALDAQSGKELWSYYTGAPIRFSPAVWKDRVYAVSDDGYLYCLSAENGKEKWKKRGGPDNSLVLGNDRMISRWPARGGVVIKDDVLYFGAGIWPTEGIYLYALNPKSGKELWLNDDSGSLEWDQPHGTARAKSGISSQGYLVAAGEHLIVPSGRAVPAALTLSEGKLDYFHLQKYRTYGGSRVFATDSSLFIPSSNSRNFQEIIGKRQSIFNNTSGELLTGDEINSQAMAISPDFIYFIDASDHELKAINRHNMLSEKIVVDRKGKQISQKNLSKPAWTAATHQPEAISLIAAGKKVIFGTNSHKVSIIDTEKKQVVWTTKVDGIPYGLTVAENRLYVSTDQGTIYCFDKGQRKAADLIRKQVIQSPYGDNKKFVTAAQEIIAQTHITDGYCLDFGCGEGQLAFELAKRTNLKIYAIDPDAKKVAIAREKLDQAGLYGTRVTVHHVDLEQSDYPDYFANLIVSGRSVEKGSDAVKTKEIQRLQRPSGGIVCIGKPDKMEVNVRPVLEGAGQWTHQYCDPGNTITSTDELVQGQLEMLWFRDDQLEMPSRHGRGVAPLYSDGRLFVQGNHGIRAVDAYNGRTLWEYYIENLMKPYDQEHLNGTAITQGNWCLEGDRLFVRQGPSIANITGRTCLVLDVETGEKFNEFRVPPDPNGNKDDYWGYIAVENGIIFGTIANTEHVTKWAYRESDMNQQFSESKALFAMDAATGKLKWMYPAEYSIRHNAIAIGDGRVYLIDKPLAKVDRLRNPHMNNTDIGPDAAHLQGKLVALDAETGNIIYEKNENIYGTLLALSTKHDELIMSYQFTRFRLPSEKRGLLTAMSASDGDLLWQVDTQLDTGVKYNFSSRPVINDTLIFLEPYTYSMRTGKRLDYEFDRSYACGILSGCKNMLLYRSATVGYFDWEEPEKGTQNFGGIRPGCWINTIPAGGLVLMPDATDRCNCSYLIKATIALHPSKNKPMSTGSL